MRAAVYYGKEDIRVSCVPDLRVGANEVLVRVRYAGICGTDMLIYSGKHPRARSPLVPGHEIIGRVEEAGPGVGAEWSRGKRAVVYPLVSCGRCAPCLQGDAHVCEKLGLVGIDRDGGFAEFVTLEPEKLVPVADDISDEEAAVVEPLAVAVHAVHNSDFRPGDTVLVTGGGPIGNLLAQVLRACGAREVVISEVKQYRRSLGEKMGFPVFDPSCEDAPEVLRRTIGRPVVDMVFEASGYAGAYDDALRCCKVRGQVSFVGMPKTPPAIDVLKIVFKEIRAASARVYTRRDYLAAIALLSRKAVDIMPLIEAVPLGNVDIGLQKMKAADTSLKILLAP